MKYKIGDRFECNIENVKTTKTIDIIEIQGGVNPYVLAGGSITNDKYLEEYYTLIEEEPTSKQVGGKHYSKLKIDPYEYSMQNDLNPLQMNAIKYVTRYNFKNGIEDLEKAIHTINRLIEYEKDNSKK